VNIFKYPIIGLYTPLQTPRRTCRYLSGPEILEVRNFLPQYSAHDWRNTTVKLTITAPVRTAKTLPITATTPKWCDPETVTLEQIDKNTRQLLREWPKDNGTPFLMEILEVLRDLKLRVRARDAANNCSVTVLVTTNTDTANTTFTPTPVYLVSDTIKPNMSVPDSQDSISTTMNSLVYPRVKQTTTELIKAFELDTATPAPIPTAAQSTSTNAYMLWIRRIIVSTNILIDQ